MLNFFKKRIYKLKEIQTVVLDEELISEIHLGYNFETVKKILVELLGEDGFFIVSKKSVSKDGRREFDLKYIKISKFNTDGKVNFSKEKSFDYCFLYFNEDELLYKIAFCRELAIASEGSWFKKDVLEIYPQAKDNDFSEKYDGYFEVVSSSNITKAIAFSKINKVKTLHEKNIAFNSFTYTGVRIPYNDIEENLYSLLYFI